MDDPLKRAAGLAARHLDTIATRPVRGAARPLDLRRRLVAAYTFEEPRAVDAVLDDVAGMFDRGLVHTTHPAHFGPYLPGVLRSAVAASTLVAAYNPHAATHTHGAAAIELERHALRFLVARLGFDPDTTHAHVTSGGQEANTEALAVALARAFPNHPDEGLAGLGGAPRAYVSAEAHHSLEKAAVLVGLGRSGVRRIPVDGRGRLDTAALRARIDADRACGDRPFLVVGTAGTTTSGAIDPLETLGEIAAQEGLGFHVDAAFGGVLALSTTRRDALRGLERADSVGFDPHKALPLPLGIGVFVSRHPEVLERVFDTESPYMPRGRDGFVDPFRTSHAWSRRAAGVPLFVALAELGEPGCQRLVETALARAEQLRASAAAAGFEPVRESPLPVVCLTHPRIERGERSVGDVVRALHRDGEVWLAPTTLSDGRRVLRACLTNHTTTARDVETLVRALRDAVEST